MPQIITAPPPSSGGGTGGPETDPVAMPQITGHKNAADPHGDRAHGDAADTAHLSAVDPHGSNAHSDAALTGHDSAVDPHGDRAAAAAHADGADTAHLGAVDPHGDRAALNAHTGAAAGAHAGSAVSVNPAGLIVVTTNNVQAALAQLDAEFAARKKLPAAPADGQLVAWNAATGQWQAVNPSGASLLDYAENNTGTTQAGLTNVTVDVTGCTIIVPASTRPVLLSAYIGGFATVAPTNASLIALITEVSNGVDTPVTIRAASPPVSAINKVVNAIVPMTQLAANTARTRTFKLQVLVPTSGTWTIENGANNDRSVLAAWGG